MNKIKKTIVVYNEIAATYAKTFEKPSEHIDEFLKFIPRNGRILDTGCGLDVDAKYIQERGFALTVIDLSKKMLETAKNYAPLVKFKSLYYRKLIFPSNSFNGALSSFSIIHIPKKEVLATLKDFHKILKKEGTLYLSFQEGNSQEIFIDSPIQNNKKLFLNVFLQKK